MTESADIVVQYWAEHREQFRQSESQRAVLTNYILVIATAASGFIVQQNLKPSTAWVAIVTSLLGVYGAIASAKYHERANYHLAQARVLTQVLVDIGALDDHRANLAVARTTHNALYPRLSRVRLYWVWTCLHIGIAAYAAILAAIILIRAAHA